MFHSERLAEYPTELQERIAQFGDGGWRETPVAESLSQ
jgi:hypothetical protein